MYLFNIFFPNVETMLSLIKGNVEPDHFFSALLVILIVWIVVLGKLGKLVTTKGVCSNCQFNILFMFPDKSVFNGFMFSLPDNVIVRFIFLFLKRLLVEPRPKAL